MPPDIDSSSDEMSPEDDADANGSEDAGEHGDILTMADLADKGVVVGRELVEGPGAGGGVAGCAGGTAT